jgi:hypothetical protein
MTQENEWSSKHGFEPRMDANRREYSDQAAIAAFRIGTEVGKQSLGIDRREGAAR